jgi:hypothetical protein
MYPRIPWERVVHPLGSVEQTLVTAGREHQSEFAKSIVSKMYNQPFREIQDIEIVVKRHEIKRARGSTMMGKVLGAESQRMYRQLLRQNDPFS